jgi:hypothetical protein
MLLAHPPSLTNSFSVDDPTDPCTMGEAVSIIDQFLPPFPDCPIDYLLWAIRKCPSDAQRHITPDLCARLIDQCSPISDATLVAVILLDHFVVCCPPQSEFLQKLFGPIIHSLLCSTEDEIRNTALNIASNWLFQNMAMRMPADVSMLAEAHLMNLHDGVFEDRLRGYQFYHQLVVTGMIEEAHLNDDIVNDLLSCLRDLPGSSDDEDGPPQ